MRYQLIHPIPGWNHPDDPCMQTSFRTWRTGHGYYESHSPSKDSHEVDFPGLFPPISGQDFCRHYQADRLRQGHRQLPEGHTAPQPHVNNLILFYQATTVQRYEFTPFPRALISEQRIISVIFPVKITPF